MFSRLPPPPSRPPPPPEKKQDTRRGLTASQTMIRVAAAQVEDWKRCSLFPWAIDHRLTVSNKVQGGTAIRCTWVFANPQLQRAWTKFFRDGKKLSWPG